jgi:hypothetical protein
MNAYTIPIAVLNLPRPDETLVTFATGVLGAITGNLKLPNPNPTVAVFTAHLEAYAAAVAAAPKGGPAAKAVRASARKPVVDDLRLIQGYAQSVAIMQTSAEDAIAVILSAGLVVKKIGKRAKRAFAAKNSGIPGTVLVVAEALRSQATFYFQYSLDQKTWMSAPDSMKASVTITGLTTMQLYYFRYRTLTRAGLSDFSQVVVLAVV